MISPKLTPARSRIAALVLFLLTGLLVLFFYRIHLASPRPDNTEALRTEAYDVAFLSMYPISTLPQETFSYYLAQDAFLSSHEISDLRELAGYLHTIRQSHNAVDTLYLGIRPDKADASALLSLLQKYPEVSYHILLAHPSVEYWCLLSDMEWSRQLQAYRDCVNTLAGQAQISLHFFSGQEWLVGNAGNYEELFLTTEDISKTLLAYSIISAPDYLVTPDNADRMLADFEALITGYRQATPIYPDLSDYSIVFLGDSIIGNFTDSTSIPEVVGVLSQAQVYNLGYGGASAAKTADGSFSLPDTVEALIQQKPEAVPEEAAQLRSGLKAYSKLSTHTRLCFVLNFGLNDYYSGLPLTSEDAYDPYTYAGAIRSSIHALKEAYPDAFILLMTPNFTSYFENGTQVLSPQGDVLQKYADTLLGLAEETGVLLLDNYYELDIRPDNWQLYLSDGCHPNEKGRFLIGQRIVRRLAEIAP